MYEAVRAHPDGDATVARFARTAADRGFEGVVVRNRPAAPDDPTFERIETAYGVDVVDGVSVDADGPRAASATVGNVRGDHEVVLVRGGTSATNRAAVENERVDVLAGPTAGDGDFNHVLAKAAVENGVRVEFDLGPVLRRSGGRRVRHLRSLRKLREIVDHYDTPFVVSATPTSHLELRAPRELVALGEEIGFPAEWIADGLREWGRVAERNRRVQSESFIEPGVERGRYDADE